MMDLIFRQQHRHVGIRVQGHHVTFLAQQGNFWKAAPIEHLKLEISGILKEYPDLKPLLKEKDGDKEIKKIAIKRFKEKIAKMKTEKEIKQYLKEDLIKYGFVLKYTRRPGHRVMKEKDN